MTILTEIIGILVGGLTGMATGIGEGLNAFVTDIFITGTGESQSLSVFGTIIVVFSGIALAIGIGRLVLNYLTGLGK